MQTLKLEIEDNLYQDILKSGLDIQTEFKKVLEKLIYHKEHKIANEINVGLAEIQAFKNGKIKLKSANTLLEELQNGN